MDGGLSEGAEPRLGGEEGEVPAEETPPMDIVATPTVESTATETGPDSASSPTPTPTTSDPPRVPTVDDDDVLLVEAPPSSKEPGPTPTPAPQTDAPTEAPSPKPTDSAEESTTAASTTHTPTKTPTPPPSPPPPSTSPSPNSSTPPDSTAPGKRQGEPIVIDDEEDSAERKNSSSALSSTEPDSEIKIANVTTLGVTSAANSVPPLNDEATPTSAVATATVEEPAGGPTQGDMNLKITSVTSLQKGGAGAGSGEENGLQISGTFSLNPEAQGTPSDLSTSKTPTFNPGRVSTAHEPVQNGETSTLQRPDSCISQSASFPRNQKQPGVDSPAPAASLPKPVASSSGSAPQPGPRTVKVTCANCRKPLKKGQTAYQRKGSAHLFCSTTCLSSFSHKPAPKKNCTMCKKDITSMKGTIVAQVDSSETFQEFCSTGCLASYESKQNPPKTAVRTKCTVCGKMTEIRHEVSFKNVTHKICSDMCFNRYRMANGLIMNCCEQCGDYLPSKASANHFLVIDGQQKRFCSQNCVRDYKQTHGKMTHCTGCRAACRSFDVTHCIGPSGAMEPYCSTACMAKNKSTSNVVSAITNTVKQEIQPVPPANQPTQCCAEPTCHFCKRSSLPQYQATLPEGTVYNFCSSSCVTKFQSANMQTLNGQTVASAPSGVQLKCNYCRGAFSLKPQVLEWENKVYQFCSKTCCDDYKKLHCIVTFCEYCQEERTLHETVSFSGVKRPFCSEGCKLLYKQDFARRLGLKCVTCNYCTQMCKRGVTKQVDDVQRDFCSEACAKKFNDWYYKALRCDCCKLQGNLTESVQWRAEMKHFCDQQCLLRFYCQQNQPNLCTQKGPENMALGYGAQLTAAKTTIFNQAVVSSFAGGMLKDVKNKAVLCKPLTMTKATYCKPHMQSKHCQTEELVKKEYVPVPIPVPVYVPVPMNLYTQATPTSVTLPVPVPVPVFLPTTLSNAEQILHTISELKTKVPADPLEADLLTMAEMIAEADDEKPSLTGVKRERVEKEDIKSESEEEEGQEGADNSYQHELDLEEDFPQAPVLLPAVEGLETEMGLALPLGPEAIKEEKPRPSVRKKGHKRRAVERDAPSDPTPEALPEGEGNPCSFPLKARYGLNAWRRWVLTSTEKPLDEKGKDQLRVKPVRLKRSLLSLSVAELNCGLARFVSEVRRPNGESYAPDSIFYLCLGIQQHLRDNGRTDDIFSDPAYHRFGQELNKVLKGWQPTVLPDGSLWGRVEEQALWSCSQLGQDSPAALLRSLVYLNTKYLGLRTVEQHLRLSFSNVYGLRKMNPYTKELSICLRIPSISPEQQVKPGTRKRKRKEEDDDPDYSPDNDSGSCPVKKNECLLYELYLSKCPAALKHRTDVFYMKPEISSSSDSPLWYSSTPLENTALESILTRILLIKDIYNRRDPLEEEGEEEEEREEEEAKDSKE
ncbi:zinc finger MYM-type protein 2-like isoform X2 [Anguilla rostrata]|uniref:zinc finger MYM-type protein 2-like isoform X2 n=1 Tax=Anguilla rostrata TaxID=7938 RepID=UPI0030CAE520